MGVHGLTSYVEGNRHFFTDVRLRDSRLVIDGCSLFFRLYFTSGLDQPRGGDYDGFATLLRHFFAVLSACTVRPFLVLDGGMDHTDKKFATLRQRAASKIKEAHALSRGSHGCILPLLTREVFKQVLSELGVPFVQCAAEADWEIASLASQWGCPVLTNDSDFYIFDLRGGYLPFSFFQWGNVNVNGKTSERFIPARRFTVNRLCSHFGHMNKQLLPLFAVVAGNDYTPAQVTEAFFSQVELPSAGGGGGRGVRGGARASLRVEGLLLWLSLFPSPAEALEAVLEVIGVRGQRSGSLRSLLSSGIRDYQLPPHSSLALFFSQEPSTTTLPGLPTALAAQPEWLLSRVASGRLPPLVLDVLVLRRALLITQVENCRLPSSHTSSLDIRRAIYSLLLSPGTRGQEGEGQESVGQGQGGAGRGGKGGRGQERQSKTGPQKKKNPSSSHSAPGGVEEYDRHELILRRSTVEPLLPKTLPQLDLNTLHQVPLPERLQVLLVTLGVEECMLGGVPAHLSMSVCVTCFWMSTSRPRPTAPLLQALLLGLVYGELNRRRTLPGDPVFSCPGVGSVCERFDRLRVSQGERRGLDLGVAHSLSQWQSCLWAGLSLNQLLCCPLLEPQCAWLFSGTLLHGLEVALRGGCPVESLLAGPPLPGQLYSSLLGMVWSSTGQNPSSSSPSSSAAAAAAAARKNRGRWRPGQQRGRGGAGRGRGNRVDNTHGLDNRFALLMSEEEEQDEE